MNCSRRRVSARANEGESALKGQLHSGPSASERRLAALGFGPDGEKDSVRDQGSTKGARLNGKGVR